MESLGYQLVVKRKVSREEWIRSIHEHAKQLSEIIGEEILVNRRVLEAELKKWDQEGAPWCVCRFQRTPDNVCPCTHHIEELKRFGRCKCGLFWRKSKCEEFRKRTKKDVSFCA